MKEYIAPDVFDVLEPIGAPMNIKGKTRYLLFNTRVVKTIQNHFDAYINDVLNSMAGNIESYEVVCNTLHLLLLEEIAMYNEEHPFDKKELDIDLEYIRTRVVTSNNALAIANYLVYAFNKQSKKEGEIPSKNAESVEMNVTTK